MIAGLGVQICDACVNVCKTIIEPVNAEADAFKPARMALAQFKVGQEFLTATGRWICTDKGKRTVIAKHVTGRDGGIPPPAVKEIEVSLTKSSFAVARRPRPSRWLKNPGGKSPGKMRAGRTGA